MKRYSDAEREWILEELRASGLSRAAFCRREGLCYATVSNWMKRGSESGGIQCQDDALTWVEVDRGGDRALEAGEIAGIEVMLPAGTRIRFAQGTDVAQVARFCREVQG